MLRLLLKLIVGLVLGSSSASADMHTFASIEGWEVSSGSNSDGEAMCEISLSNRASDELFMLKAIKNVPRIIIQAWKNSGHIPQGTVIPIAMTIGDASPWSAQATGGGSIVSFFIALESLDQFETEFRLGRALKVSFPQGNEPDWIAGLKRSSKVMDNFVICLQAMDRPTQPFSNNSAPTQPFSDIAPPDETPRCSQPYSQPTDDSRL